MKSKGFKTRLLGIGVFWAVLCLLAFWPAHLGYFGRTVHAQSGHSVKLTWIASTSPNVTYNVWRGTASGQEMTQLNTAPVAGLTFTDTTGVGGTQYFYVVRAVNVAGVASDNSNEASATFLVDKPLPPSGLAAVSN